MAELKTAPLKQAVKVHRETFLKVLEDVAPGLSPREIVEQSGCVVFRGGRAETYNEEIYCSAKSGLPKDFAGAVAAGPLLKLVQKMPDDHLGIETAKDQLVVTGKRRRAEVAMQGEVLLPTAQVDAPAEWLKLHPDFADAVAIVGTCVGKDETDTKRVSVHVHPKWMEACDNFQLTRYGLKTGVKEPVLIRGDSLRHVAGLDLTEVGETDTWLHFRGPGGFRFSCKRWLASESQYDDFGPQFAVAGAKCVLPRALGEAVDRAEVFSEDNADKTDVLVELKKGAVRVTGSGAAGRYVEVKKLKYDGPAFRFLIAPKLLVELVRRHTDCMVSKDRLLVDGGKFKYVACLEQADAPKADAGTED